MLIATISEAQKEGSIWVDAACGMCKDRIELATLSMDKMQFANYDLSTNTLQYKNSNPDFDVKDLHQALANAGHDTKLIKATEEVYESLHACCHYRSSESIHEDEKDNKEDAESQLENGTYDSNTQTLGENEIWVDGICYMCKERIELATLSLKGMKFANYDVATNILTFENKKVDYDVMKLHKALAKIGHDTELLKASEDAYSTLHGCCKYRDAAIVADHQAEIEEDGNPQIWVDGLCDMCKDRIELTALAIDGMKFAHYNVQSKMLTYEHKDEQYDPTQLHQALANVGHDTKLVKASQEAYDNLHACCKYKDTDVIADHRAVYTFEEANSIDKISSELTSQEFDENLASGMVYEKLPNGKEQPLIGANIFWLGTTEGTATDVDGHFQLPKSKANSNLVISYLGAADTIDMKDQSIIAVILDNSVLMDEVVVKYRTRSTRISFIEPIKVHSIGEKELMKAACCNLSESFETTPAVDVSFTDAVTGVRKIEMLGLAGPNVQITRENMPYIRGLAAIYGFLYTPGSWIQGMQLNMGTGSVANGPEAITGQINIEVKKPEQLEKLYVNLYANQAERLEANVNASVKINGQLSTAFLIHGQYRNNEIDNNNDGFLDAPFNKHLIALNRWKYVGPNGLMAQFGIKGTFFNNESGQLPSLSESPQHLWQVQIRTNRFEGWFKMGKVFLNKPTSSIGLQFSVMHQDQNSRFGSRPYYGNQSTIYANFIYQGNINNPRHLLRLGSSFIYDKYDEHINIMEFDRIEVMPGVFAEYNYKPNDQFSMLAGLRADYHNLYGLFFTPRIHFRYSPSTTIACRIMAGRGLRTASIFAENIGAFASNRKFVVHSENPNYAYGLNPEIGWNFGVNFTKELSVFSRSLVFGIDYYFTNFQNQVVVDYDINPQEVHFYNLNGDSYSHSIQTHLDYQINDVFDLRLAYRYNDVQTAFMEGLDQKQLTAKHRAFLNIGWKFVEQWNIDLTANWIGPKRIPDTRSNPAEFQLEAFSPSFVTMNTQLSGGVAKNTEAYLGVENLLNFRQDNPILSAADPNSKFFDSSLVWGPILGRNIYVGVRYKLK